MCKIIYNKYTLIWVFHSWRLLGKYKFGQQLKNQ